MTINNIMRDVKGTWRYYKRKELVLIPWYTNQLLTGQIYLGRYGTKVDIILFKSYEL